MEALHGNGQLSLNTKCLDLVEFSRCTIRTYSDWRCKGDGRRGSRMAFIATPNDANLLLSHLTNTPYYHETEDEISILVYDGAGSDCLDVAEHKLYGNSQLSVHPWFVRKQGAIYPPYPQTRSYRLVPLSPTDQVRKPSAIFGHLAAQELQQGQILQIRHHLETELSTTLISHTRWGHNLRSASKRLMTYTHYEHT